MPAWVDRRRPWPRREDGPDGSRCGDPDALPRRDAWPRALPKRHQRAGIQGPAEPREGRALLGGAQLRGPGPECWRGVGAPPDPEERLLPVCQEMDEVVPDVGARRLDHRAATDPQRD